MWSDANIAYRGISVPGFPNWFMLGGPNSPIGNFSFLMTVEHQLNYVLQLVALLQAGKAEAIAEGDSSSRTVRWITTERSSRCAMRRNSNPIRWIRGSSGRARITLIRTML